jgi:threonine/homoserine/homoserine lactone efflux protein
MIDHAAAGLFVVAAAGLLGSPGPAIAALIAVGKSAGFVGGLRYFIGLQLGLALAAAISAGGLVAVLLAYPAILHALAIVATIYLLFLAWQVATAPVGNSEDRSDGTVAASPIAGFVLGVTNPKAYIAFAALIASHPLVPTSMSHDAFIKWLLIVVVMIVVDLIWLVIGVALGRTALSPHHERIMNLSLAGMILIAALLPLLPA